MTKPDPIKINVDPTNPGQFFACCGLLELADRLWDGAEGAFSASGAEFSVRCKESPSKDDATQLRCALASCAITSTMSEDQIARLKKLLNQKKATLTPQEAAEKQELSELWERERIRLHGPFDVWIDWWGDDHAGGSNFKTWAGKQFVLDLVRGMQAPIRSMDWSPLPLTEWLKKSASDSALPLYFDADIGGQSSSIDVGFSMDALDMRSRTRPMIELAAFVGLQRFRPLPERNGESFSYVTWTESLPPALTAVACCGRLPQQNARTFEFRLLYRTKYLKSFLPAKPKGG